MTRMPETYLDAASTTPLHPRARAALLAAAVGELREMADLDSQALERVARERR